jgi:hypothetical protein
MKRKIFKAVLALVCLLAIAAAVCIGVAAEADLPEENAVFDEKEADVPTENSFSRIYEFINENSDKLLSLCSFIGTLVIALLYKNGFIPGLKRATASVSEALNRIKEESERIAKGTQSNDVALEKLLDQTQKQIKAIEAMCDNPDRESLESERRVIRALMSEEVELLGDIFMSSSLPDYKKEEVGVRLNKLRETIKNEEQYCE